MSNNLTDLRTHKFKKGDKILVDTNVWMFIYGPLVKADWRTTAYSNSIRDMRTYNCNIYVDTTILSEFINAFARYEYNLVPASARPEFKKFRNSAAFEPIANEISININKILKITKRCETPFHDMDVPSIIGDFSKGKFDYNDLVLEDLCKIKGLTLLTHDGDFSGKGINILTANNKLQNI